MKFERRDSKEVFAYLIDRRGAVVSADELVFLLWGETEKESKKSYIRNLISDIRNAFASCGETGIVLNSRGFYRVDTSRIRCDYYDYLEGNAPVSAKMCEYMEQYMNWSWHTKEKLFGCGQ